jgi:hypothetical protein
MISSAALSGRVSAQPPAGLHGYPRGAAEAPTPNSSKARPGVTSTGRALNGIDSVHLMERHTIPMTNIQQQSDRPAGVLVTMTAEELESLLHVAFGRGYAKCLAKTRAGA